MKKYDFKIYTEVKPLNVDGTWLEKIREGRSAQNLKYECAKRCFFLYRKPYYMKK